MMSTISTLPTDIQERLSLAYVTAMAARAGCQVTEPKVDRNGIDASITPISGAPVRIDIQLKAVSTRIRIRSNSVLSYQLDVSTYNKLRRTDAQAPQLLVVYEMPSIQDKWLKVDSKMTTLKNAAFWVDLRGEPAVTTESTAVHIPASNLFDHNAIRSILEQAHERALNGLAWA